MKKKRSLEALSRRIVALFASEWFWRAMLSLFVVQAVYIALVGRFSMAFDEHFHLKAIQEYAKVLFPWQVTQPAGPAELSAFTADGSYLYHYLMSFPYRLIQLITSSQTGQIVLMRLMDVGIVVAGKQLFRRLLRELGTSRAASHVILAFVMLMPMAPFMAGQLTYDALFFTLVGFSMLLFVRLLRTVREQKMLALPLTAWTVTVVLTTLQVKYAFFPAALGAGGYVLGYLAWLTYKKQMRWQKLWPSWKLSLQTGAGALSVGAMLLTGVLFVQRYGMNYIQYGSLVPECSDVLGHERCLGFAPYGRDAEIRENEWYKSISAEQKREYVGVWYEKMIYESYFATGPKELNYPTADPMRVPYTAGRILAAIGVLVLVVGGWRIMARGGAYAQLLFATVATYVLFLFAKNYGAFLATAVPLSIHGRYVLPFLPLAGYLVYLGLKPLAQTTRTRTIAALVVSGLLTASLWGGGITTYIVRSNDAWYWQAAQPVSRLVRSAVWPLVLK